MPTAAAVWRDVRARVRSLGRGFRGVMGADAYERYLDHRARTHPGLPVMTRAEFWRERMDEQDRNPSARCC